MSAEPEKKQIFQISDVLKNVFREIETKGALSRDEVDAAWKEIAGERAAGHSRPVLVRNEILTVQVDSSVWLQDLNFQKRNILKGLKKKFGKDRISEIRFKIGEF